MKLLILIAVIVAGMSGCGAARIAGPSHAVAGHAAALR